MELEELINSHKEVIKYSEKMKGLADNVNDINRLIKQHTQELEYLEELKSLRVELEKNSKEMADIKGVAEFQQKCNMERGFRIKELEEELKVYKKALEFVCKKIDTPNYKEYAEWCLQKAREQNNEKY